MNSLNTNKYNNIGITGSLGSGKSFLSKSLFNNKNILEVDDIRRFLLWKSLDLNAIELRKELIQQFNLIKITDTFMFDRTYFTQLIFSSLENLKISSNIIAPYIKKHITDITETNIQNKKNIIVWAYLIEENYIDLIDFVYIIYSSKDKIKSRLIENNQNYDDLLPRFNLEPSLESRIKTLIDKNIPYEVIINE